MKKPKDVYFYVGKMGGVAYKTERKNAPFVWNVEFGYGSYITHFFVKQKKEVDEVLKLLGARIVKK